jgi:hypothetical protein
LAAPKWQPCLALRGLEQYSLAQEIGTLPKAIKLQGYKAARLAQAAPIQEIPDKGKYGSCLIL